LFHYNNTNFALQRLFMADNSIITPKYASTMFFCTTHPLSPKSEVENNDA
jgi:hypothetical protein